MKKGFFLLFTVFITFNVHSAVVENIKFKQEGETSKLILNFDNDKVDIKRFHVKDDKQIIVDIKDVRISDKLLRGMDTSEFRGSVVYVSPYRRPGKKNDLRLAIQLRDNVRSSLTRVGKQAILTVENRFGVFSQEKVISDKQQNTQKGTTTLERKKRGFTNVHVPKSNSIEDILENITLSGPKKYIGKKISVNVKELPIAEILKIIADSSGFNIILGDEVEKVPPLSLNLTNIPWDQALDTVLELGKLVGKKNGNILMVSTLQKATEERRLKLQSAKLNEKQEPLVTKIIPISFAKIKDISKILEDYLTKERGRIAVDERTNAIIVKDTIDVIDRMVKIVETLDAATPQVLIESKIVEVSEGFQKEIGLQRGVNFGYDPVGDIADAVGPGFTFSSAPASGERDFFGVSIESFKRLIGLDFTLQLMESESKAKIISSPKIITQNKEPAEIKSTETTSFIVRTQNGNNRNRIF